MSFAAEFSAMATFQLLYDLQFTPKMLSLTPCHVCLPCCKLVNCGSGDPDHILF